MARLKLSYVASIALNNKFNSKNKNTWIKDESHFDVLCVQFTRVFPKPSPFLSSGEVLVALHVINVCKNDVQWNFGLLYTINNTLQLFQVFVAVTTELVAKCL